MEEILHGFDTEATGGVQPSGGLTFDGKGNFYGPTYSGGADGHGEFFEFKPQEGGGWEHTVSHYFGHRLDGAVPCGGIVVDASGNVFRECLWDHCVRRRLRVRDGLRSYSLRHFRNAASEDRFPA